jgi:NADPH:quinone reductase
MRRGHERLFYCADMRALVCRQLGPLDDLTVEERDPAPCGPGQVRLAMRAAGVNFVDALLAQGLYQVKPPTPYVPGGEACGIITEVGEGVDTLAVGDRVLAMCGAGGFADELVVRASVALKVPDTLSDGQVATFLQSYMTAWFALVERAKATAGQSILVLGAGGGVGLAAVDVAKALGLRVIAGASSAEKRAVALAAGADAVIDTTSDSIKDVAREWSGTGGVDLAYDPVGGDLGEQALRAVAPLGQYLVVGFAGGSIPKLPANLVLLRNRNVTGIDWGGWVGDHQARNAELIAELMTAIIDGRLHPVEPTTYRLTEAAAALMATANRQSIGKLAVIP